jgi:phosphoglycerol transferase MdoB-like AlkP superfamily enzyme
MDVEYFKYTSKRSTFDLFTMLGTGSDFGQLWTTFIKDFWIIILIFIGLIILTEFLYRRWEQKEPKPESLKKFFIQNSAAFLIVVPLFLIIGRGGFALKPTGIIEASRYTKPENLAFVLPTPFTMIKTIDQGGLEQVTYMPDDEAQKLFNPIKQTQPQEILPNGTNVVIIMLESFGTEFTGLNDPNNSYTPFLDSLMNESLRFKYGFANGKRSIEAVPALLASIPTMMENPYISSPYGNNTINTLPNILKKHGYESAFYHAATNGSMSFDGFAEICGFDHYFGRYEYNNDDHFDKTWGILDHHFNPWSAKKMSELKEPFFSTIFTISSHHPYFIPKNLRKNIKYGPQKICGSINYGDFALRRFFDEAKKQPWFENTLFVFLADHTPATSSKVYNQRSHMFRIPIAFYHPSGKINPELSEKPFQQLDIMPTILDLLNIDTRYYAYGNSYYSDENGEVLTYLGGSYHHFKNGRMTVFSDEKAQNLYNYTLKIVDLQDSLSFYKKDVQKVEKVIKATIQRYNQDLIRNQTTVDEATH